MPTRIGCQIHRALWIPLFVNFRSPLSVTSSLLGYPLLSSPSLPFRQVDMGQYQELLQTDQLHKEMAAKRAFLGFTEVRSILGVAEVR